MKKYFLLVVFGVLMGGCASITNDSYVPVALSFSDGSKGECDLENKRYAKTVDIPGTADVRRSDDNLKYRCKSNNGKKHLVQFLVEWAVKLWRVQCFWILE